MRRCFALLKSIKNNGSNRGNNRVGSSIVKNTSLLSPQSSLTKAKATSLSTPNNGNNTQYYANVANKNNNKAFDSDLSSKSAFASSSSVANTNGCEALARSVYLPWEARPAEYLYKAHESDWLHLDTLLNCLISNAEKVVESYGKHSGHMFLDKINRPVRKTRRCACNTKAFVSGKDNGKTLKNTMHYKTTIANTNKTKAKRNTVNNSNMCRRAQYTTTKRESKTSGNANQRKGTKNLNKIKSTFPTRHRAPKLQFKVITTSLVANERRKRKQLNVVNKAVNNSSKRFVLSQRSKSKIALKLSTRPSVAKQKCNKNNSQRRKKH